MNRNSTYTQASKTNNAVLVALILAPILLTMIMWSFLPSGYQRTVCKKEVQGSIQSWQPLQAGFKFILSSSLP